MIGLITGRSLSYSVIMGLSEKDREILLDPQWIPVSEMTEYEKELRSSYAFLTPGYDYYLLFNDESLVEFRRQAIVDTVKDVPGIVRKSMTRNYKALIIVASLILGIRILKNK